MVTACSTPGLEGFATTDITVGGDHLTVAVADTSTLRSQGLQGVAELPRGLDGMLFVFDQPRAASFHMRTVGLDLDIWWFNEKGHLVDVTEMTTCLDTTCVTYPSPGEIEWALETPAGAFDFAAGQALEFP